MSPSGPTAPPAPVSPPTRGSRRRRLVIEYLVIAALAIGLALVVQAYVVKPYKIPSESMQATLLPGDRVFVNRFIYHFRDVDRGDIVVFRAPGSGVVLIKRVIGLPGETISLRSLSTQNGVPIEWRVFINDRQLNEPYVNRGPDGAAVNSEPFATGMPWALTTPYKVPADSYFMMGDNRDNSGDSREFGPVSKDDLIGSAFFIYWPVRRISIL